MNRSGIATLGPLSDLVMRINLMVFIGRKRGRNRSFIIKSPKDISSNPASVGTDQWFGGIGGTKTEMADDRSFSECTGGVKPRRGVPG